MNNNLLVGGAGADQLYGGTGHDYLIGGAGADILRGGDQNDTLIGGLGNDQLEGGNGVDTYVIEADGGSDTITDTDGQGTIKFAGTTLSGGSRNGIFGTYLSADGKFRYVANKGASPGTGVLVVTCIATGQKMGIRNFSSGQFSINLTEGTTSKPPGTVGLASNDLLGYFGSSLPTSAALRHGVAADMAAPQMIGIYGKGGNDFILAPDGSGTLEGDEGNDYIYAGNGLKLITGGSGDDHIQGNWRLLPRVSSNPRDIWNNRYQDWTLRYTASRNLKPFYVIPDEGMDIHLDLPYHWELDGTPQSGSQPRLDMNKTEQKAANTSGFFADGGEGKDFVEGGNGADSLMGNIGQDTVVGNGGDDQLYGDAGEDCLVGDDGNDTLDGGDDSDTLVGVVGDDLLSGGGGNDYLYGGSFDERFSGSDDDRLYGGEGNDTLDGNGGSDQLFGDEGNDLVVESGAGALADRNLLDGGDGNDTVWAGTGNNNLFGGNGNDVLLVGSATLALELIGDNYLDGGDGEDKLQGAKGNDTLAGGEGLDSVRGGAGEDQLFGEGGNDLLTGEEGKDTLTGGEGSDSLNGGDGDDTLDGGEGDDRLDGGDGNDLLQGGEGTDGLYGDAGNDTLSGDGEDYLDGGEGDDSISGSDSDILQGGSGSDTLQALGSGLSLQGGEGDDRYLMADAIDGEARSEIIDAAGSNRIVLDASLDEIAVANSNIDLAFNAGGTSFTVRGGLRNGNFRFTALAESSGTPTTAHIAGTPVAALAAAGVLADTESTELDLSFKTLMNSACRTAILLTFEDRQQASGFFGGQANDNVTGSLLADNLDGNSGNDTLSGRAGNDTLIGDLGDDSLYGDAGNDQLDGGLGNDSYGYLRGEGHDQISDTGGDDTLNLFDIALSQLTVSASGRDLSLRLNEQDDVLVKGGMDGAINHFAFSGGTVSLGYLLSRLRTAPLNLTGTAAAESLEGGMGNDTLNGLAGNDSLAGYDGSDTYRFAQGDGRDTINDQGAIGESNTLQFAANIVRADMRLKQAGNDLLVSFANNGDAISIQNYFIPVGTVSEFRFADGQAWNRAAIQQKLLADSATAGNDTLQGGAGDDLLNGLAGDDVLNGGEGNDTLNGGVGNDSLNGGWGDNLYQFDAGFGQDSLRSDYAAGQDLIQFGTGLLASQLVLTRPSDTTDLVIGFQGRSDTLLLADFFNRYATYSHLASLHFADGSSLGRRALHDAYFAGLANQEDNYIPGTEMADTLRGLGGKDYLTGRDGDDLLEGGDGDDDLSGDEGNDTLVGGAGNDRLSGGAGNDVLKVEGGGIDHLSDTTGSDTVQLWQGTTLADLTFQRNYFMDQLDIGRKGSSEVVQLSGYWRYPDFNQIQGGTILLADGTAITPETFYAQALRNSAGNDLITNFASDDRLLQGLAGNDRIEGGRGNDTLEGGAGDDTVIGYGGEDTFVFGRGDGQDLLVNYDNNGTRSPDGSPLPLRGTLKLRDLRAADISIRSGDQGSLLLEVLGSNDKLTIAAYFRDINNGNAHNVAVARIQFADGVIWGKDEIQAARLNYQLGYEQLFEGDAGNNQLQGQATRDLLRAYAGNDNLFGFGGDDRLEGGDGNDYLSGGDGRSADSGNDLLMGGNGDDQLNGEDGNDKLLGGVGNDKYVFKANWGQDVIDNTGGGTDWLIFSDVERNQFSFRREGNDLMIGVVGDASRSVRVLNHFNGGEAAIAYVQPKSGNGISAAEIARLIPPNTPTAGNDNLNGTAVAESLAGGAGNDTIYGLGGNDSLAGDDGDDRLNGGDGDDNLRGGNGNDQLFGETGNDLLDGGGGDNTLAGGLGHDFYIVSNGREVIVENANEGSDTVVTGVSYTLGNQVENITLAPGTAAINGTGNALNNVLTGNNGANRLDGGLGSDTYTLAKGGGADVIRDFDTTANNVDAIQFKDVKSTEISAVQKVGANLVLKYGATDQVTVENYFDATNALSYRIEQFKFSDSVVWNNTQIQAKVVTAKLLGDTVPGAGGIVLPRPPMVANQVISVDQQLTSLVSAMAAFAPIDAGLLHQTVPAHEHYSPLLSANRLI
ncbi:calcium-binding protein [Chitinimonas arctica]|uniref:calcium-binding protein n=1 Tax=Chitinimonas arctica TaxID=2594795 RepID=UPI0015D32B73|nr:calcium-binding protein [Chitinimonas arctica]